MSLFGGLGLIVVKKRDQENGKNDLEGLLPWISWKALQIASMTLNIDGSTIDLYSFSWQ